MFFAFDNEGRVMISARKAVAPGMVELDPPKDFDPEWQADWVWLGGSTWVLDPLPRAEEEQQPTPEERLAKLEEENAQLKEALELILSGEVGADG